MEDKSARFENTRQFISLDAGLQGDFLALELYFTVMVFGGQIAGSDSRQETDICVPHSQVDRKGQEDFSLLVSQDKIKTMFVQ
jgi:hypothetical protein